MHFNKIEYHPIELGGSSRTCTESFTQFAGQLGAGTEIDLGPLELIADIRWLFMQARPERAADIRAAAPLATQSTDASSSDELINGLQLTVGVGGNF